MTVQLSGTATNTKNSGVLPKPWIDTHKEDMGTYNPVERMQQPSTTQLLAQRPTTMPMRLSDDSIGFKHTNKIEPANTYAGQTDNGVTYGNDQTTETLNVHSELLSLPISTTEWAATAIGAVVVAMIARKALNTGPVLTIASVLVGAIAGKYVSQKI